MFVHLTEEGQQIVTSYLQEGRFPSEDEVVAQALRLLKEYDEHDKLAELRREIAIGIEKAERGELVSFDPHATLQRIRSRQASTAGQS